MNGFVSPLFSSSVKFLSQLHHQSVFHIQISHLSLGGVKITACPPPPPLRYGAQLGQQQQQRSQIFFPVLPALPSVASHPRERPATSQRPSKHWRQESASHRSLQCFSLSVNPTFIHFFSSWNLFFQKSPLHPFVYRALCLVCRSMPSGPARYQGYPTHLQRTSVPPEAYAPALDPNAAKEQSREGGKSRGGLPKHLQEQHISKSEPKLSSPIPGGLYPGSYPPPSSRSQHLLPAQSETPPGRGDSGTPSREKSQSKAMSEQELRVLGKSSVACAQGHPSPHPLYPHTPFFSYIRALH